jgi:transposase
VVLRQEHRAGEKMFVDYAGATIPIHDPEGGEPRQAAVFVAVLGAQQLYLRRSRQWAGPAELDRLAYARLGVLRRSDRGRSSG